MKAEKTERLDRVPDTKQSLESIKSALPQAPVFAFVEKFDAFLRKKKRVLTKGEVLFEPGENPYIYIVTSGALAIFRTTNTQDRKEVGRAYAGSFIGEGILSDRNQKDVAAESVTERTEVAALTKADIEYLESQSPETLAKLYKHINNVTSLRLAESGRELAILYEMTEKFQEFRERGQRGLLDAILHLRNVLDLDAALLIEDHPLVKWLRIYKYNSRFPTVWPLNQKVDPAISLEDGAYDGPLIMGTKPDDSVRVCTLKTAGKIVGFLVLSSKNPLSDADIRIVANAASSVASMLEQTQHAEDAKARSLKDGTYLAQK